MLNTEVENAVDEAVREKVRALFFVMVDSVAGGMSESQALDKFEKGLAIVEACQTAVAGRMQG